MYSDETSIGVMVGGDAELTTGGSKRIKKEFFPEIVVLSRLIGDKEDVVGHSSSERSWSKRGYIGKKVGTERQNLGWSVKLDIKRGGWMCRRNVPMTTVENPNKRKREGDRGGVGITSSVASQSKDRRKAS